VLDAEARVARAVRSARVLEGVERHADGAVADGVDVDLEAGAVGHRDEVVELPLRVGRAARAFGLVAVRLDHRGRVRLNHAVEHELDGADFEERPRVLARERGDALDVCLCRALVDVEGEARAQRQLTAVRQFLVEFEVGLAAAGVLDARDAERGGHLQRAADGFDPALSRGRRDFRTHEAHRALLEHSRRLLRPLVDD
jgi:hypothetical protein